MLGTTVPPEVRQKISAKLKGTKLSAEVRAKISAGFTPESRESIGISNAKRMRERRLQQGPNRVELGLYWMLANAGIKFDKEVRFGRYVVDAYDPVTKTAYEADGIYWHDAERDARRDAYLATNHGLRVVRFTEEEIWAFAS